MRVLAPLLLAALFLASGVRADAGTGLRVLTYNTHGLPAWIAGDDPEARFPQIGRLAERYDVALLQEDFDHHERLLEGATRARAFRGNASRFPACFFCSGSGLTALVGGGAIAEVEQHEHGPYTACAGWLGGANDCLATKGFLRLRLRLTGGAWLDVVDTHLDAGSAAADRAARARQLDTLAAALRGSSDGAALVVAGDLNLRREDPADAALLERFLATLGLHDALALPDPGRDWEHLDYVLYRSGAGAHLRVEEAGEDRDFVGAQGPLSDHPALFARFDVEPGPDARAPLNASSTSPRRPGSPSR